MHPEAPNRLYASCGDGFMGGPDRAYLESYNSGNSWISRSEGLEHHYLYSMAIDPADCNTILVSAAPSAISLITVFLMNLIYIVKRKILRSSKYNKDYHLQSVQSFRCLQQIQQNHIRFTR